VYRARRRRVLLGVILVLLLAHTARQFLNDTGHVRMPTARTRNDGRRTYVSAVRWLLQGQRRWCSVTVGRRRARTSSRSRSPAWRR
jgi:hypothetical protein